MAIPCIIFNYDTGEEVESCESLKQAAVRIFMNPQKAKTVGEHARLKRKKFKSKNHDFPVYVRLK